MLIQILWFWLVGTHTGNGKRCKCAYRDSGVDLPVLDGVWDLLNGE